MSTTTPTFETLIIDVDDDLAIATIHRPHRRNAVSRQLLHDLIGLADWLEGHPKINFLILTGHGPIFAAGQDLKELREELANPEAHPNAARSLQRLAQSMMTKLENLEQITFTAIQGSAYGAGVAISITTDFRVIAEDAVLSLPETKLGMFLTYGSLPRLVGMVGLSKAKDFVMFARSMSAQDALAVGAVNWVTTADQVLDESRARVDELRQMDQRSLRITKRIAQAAAQVTAGDIMLSEPEVADGAMSDGATLARLDAFLNGTS